MKGLSNVPGTSSSSIGNSMGFDYMKTINRLMPKSGGGHKYTSRTRTRSRTMAGGRRKKSMSRTMAGGRRKKSSKK